ncbi:MULTISPECIES: hypothetical protein [Virgibacillus]|uniref:hypothetical protein n=1 Tax=Virgibacillus TaxID=84406 RepID=UPI0013CEB4D4|nr:MULTISPECIES: hypothetical protein [Virgibacillus]
MSVYKATITLIIVALILFGSFVALSTGVLDPMIEKIGSGFNTMVDNVFGGEGMPK